MGIIDIAGLSRKLEEGQGDLLCRLDRIIELLETMATEGTSATTIPYPAGRNGKARAPLESA